MIERHLRSLSPRFFSLIQEEAELRQLRHAGLGPRPYPLPTHNGFAQMSNFLGRQLAGLKASRLTARGVCQLAAEIFQVCLVCEAPVLRSVRTALAITLTFLHHNDIEIRCPEMSLFEMAVETASQESSAEEFAAFLGDHVEAELQTSIWVVH